MSKLYQLKTGTFSLTTEIGDVNIVLNNLTDPQLKRLHINIAQAEGNRKLLAEVSHKKLLEDINKEFMRRGI